MTLIDCKMYDKEEHIISRSILPLLVVLNAVDAILLYYLFKEYGVDVERNHLITALLNFDNSAVLFLVLKLIGSALILYYWIKAEKVRPWIHVLGTIGVAVYLVYFGSELDDILQILYFKTQ